MSRRSPAIRRRRIFANTIAALELADERLSRVLGVFFNLAGADTNPKREELQRAFSPKLARLFLGDHDEPGAFRPDRGPLWRGARRWDWTAEAGAGADADPARVPAARGRRWRARRGTGWRR